MKVSEFSIENRVVMFMDVHNFSKAAVALGQEQYRFVQAMYERLGDLIVEHGGEIVKYLGDAGLAVFDEASVESGIMALATLTGEARECGRDHGLNVYLNVSIHFGTVLAGTFGPPGSCSRTSR